LPQDFGDGMSAHRAVHRLDEGLDRLFTTLLGLEGGPLVVARSARIFGSLQVQGRLFEPIRRAIHRWTPRIV